MIAALLDNIPIIPGRSFLVEFFVISVTAAGAALLTFFSGFGLGTMLTPVLAIFFPLEISIALTGIVHLLNNFFKIILVAKQINFKVGFRFGVFALLGSLLGAWLLTHIPTHSSLLTYRVFDKFFEIQFLKLVIASLMIVFVLIEWLPYLKNLQFQQNKLPLGGFLSGFFGGLSGHQGALRSAFLLRSGLSKEGFIATGIFIACAVDLSRLSVYFSQLTEISLIDNFVLLSAAILSAFAGSFLGSRLLKKVTYDLIQTLVGFLIIILAIGLGLGVL